MDDYINNLNEETVNNNLPPEPPIPPPDRDTSIKSFAFFKYTPEQITKFLGKLGEYAIFVGIVLVMVFAFTKGCDSSGKDIKEIKQEVKEYNKRSDQRDLQIDSIKQTNEFLASRLLMVEASQEVVIQTLNRQNQFLVSNNRKIDELKKLYNAQIKNVNNFNINQLDSFFANRYKEYYKP